MDLPEDFIPSDGIASTSNSFSTLMSSQLCQFIDEFEDFDFSAAIDEHPGSFIKLEDQEFFTAIGQPQATEAAAESNEVFEVIVKEIPMGEEIPGDDASPLCLTGETIEISNIECFNCEELFTEDGFELHACMFDENHQPVVAVDTETEFKKLHRQTMEMLEQNQTKIRELCEKAQGVKPRLDCFKCGRKFVNESGFIRHYEKHIGELVPESPEENADNLRSVILCVICGEVFTAESEVWDHLQSRHVLVFSGVRDCKIRKEAEEKKQEGDVGKCCDAKSNDQFQPDVAYISTHDYKSKEFVHQIIVSKVFQCEFCDALFADVKPLLEHTAGHSPWSWFSCEACELHGLSLTHILLHRHSECVFLSGSKNPLKDFSRVWVCNVCDGEFRGLEQLIDHRYRELHFFPRMESRTKQLVFPCERCLQTFPRAPQLVEHIREVHIKAPKLNEVFQTSDRAEHVTKPRRGGIHQTSALPRLFLCEVCGKSYTQSSHLWQHLRFHKGVKPFVCTVEGCGRAFTIRPDLSDHIRKTHTGERPYLCTICQKRFLTGSVYYQHRLTHSGDRRYGCGECGKRFYRADALKNHELIHTGLKPFTCSICEKTFRQRGDRDKHIKARHPNAEIVPSPRKIRQKSFGRGRTKNNLSLYSAMPLQEIDVASNPA